MRLRLLRRLRLFLLLRLFLRLRPFLLRARANNHCTLTTFVTVVVVVVVVVGSDREQSSLTERYQSLYADLIRALASAWFSDVRVARASLAGIVDIVYDSDEGVKMVV